MTLELVSDLVAEAQNGIGGRVDGHQTGGSVVYLDGTQEHRRIGGVGERFARIELLK